MKTEKIDLYDFFHIPRSKNCGGVLTSYVLTPSKEIKAKMRPSILIFPGGGYQYISDREGEPVAMRFVEAGYNAFVLNYSVSVPHPIPLQEAYMAMAYVRERVAVGDFERNHIVALGFSAGGHLAGMLGISPFYADLGIRIKKKEQDCRPNAVILSYPVISMKDGITHNNSRTVICGGDEALYNELSLEKVVGQYSAPAFIWHTFEDICVPMENSLRLAEAYRKEQIPFSLHIFEKGGHGLSLCNTETNNQTEADKRLSYIGKWVELALDWLTARGFAVETCSEDQK